MTLTSNTQENYLKLTVHLVSSNYRAKVPSFGPLNIIILFWGYSSYNYFAFIAPIILNFGLAHVAKTHFFLKNEPLLKSRVN